MTPFLSLLLTPGCSGDPADTPGTHDSADIDTDTTADSADTSSPGDSGDSGDTGSNINPATFAALVSQTEIGASISALQDFGTRYTFTSGEADARDYLVERFEALGYVPELDVFTLDSQQTANIIVRIDGTQTPDEVTIFSAHYDSTSTAPMTDAPGADDNASGVAAVLEAARVFQGQSFSSSIWLVLTAAEEQGSKGSEHLVGWLSADPVNVNAVIAPDMIGYWPLGEGDLVDILGDDDSAHLVNQMSAMADRLGVAHKTWVQHSYCYGDDHTNFQEAGFPAITPMDCVEAHNVWGSGETLPHYHQTSDTIDTVHLPFTTQVAGLIVATLAELAGPLG